MQSVEKEMVLVLVVACPSFQEVTLIVGVDLYALQIMIVTQTKLVLEISASILVSIYAE